MTLQDDLKIIKELGTETSIPTTSTKPEPILNSQSLNPQFSSQSSTINLDSILGGGIPQTPVKQEQPAPSPFDLIKSTPQNAILNPQSSTQPAVLQTKIPANKTK
jgi:hypothetical protein